MVRTVEDGGREGVVLVFVVLCSCRSRRVHVVWARRRVLVLYPRCRIVVPYSGRLVVVRRCRVSLSRTSFVVGVSRCGHGDCGVVVDVDVVWCGRRVVVWWCGGGVHGVNDDDER